MTMDEATAADTNAADPAAVTVEVAAMPATDAAPPAPDASEPAAEAAPLPAATEKPARKQRTKLITETEVEATPSSPPATTAPWAPRVGDWVQYRLTKGEAESFGSLVEQSRCNSYVEGDVVAALVVRVWGVTCVNLRAFVDGEPSLWLTSRCAGDGVMNWQPVRA